MAGQWSAGAMFQWTWLKGEPCGGVAGGAKWAKRRKSECGWVNVARKRHRGSKANVSCVDYGPCDKDRKA